MTSTPTACRWVVSGRVQGVGFRWFVLRAAERAGVVGWATNLPDGRVEVVAKGAPPALDVLGAALAVGPRLARVQRIERTDIPGEGIAVTTFLVK